MAGNFRPIMPPEDGPGKSGADFAALHDEYPNLAWALNGRAKNHEAGPMNPCTLNLFLDNGRLKWCLSLKWSSKCCFGTCPDPSKPLAAVEAALIKGELEWKSSGRRPST